MYLILFADEEAYDEIYKAGNDHDWDMRGVREYSPSFDRRKRIEGRTGFSYRMLQKSLRSALYAERRGYDRAWVRWRYQDRFRNAY